MNVIPGETLGMAMAVAKKPVRPAGPRWRENHPTLKSNAIEPALPVRSIKGNEKNVQAYVKALRGGQ